MTDMDVYRLLKRMDNGYVPTKRERRELNNLIALDLSFTDITELPDSIGELNSLQKLDLSYSGITELPDSIGELKSLQELDLGGTDITALPDSIGELKNLQWLYLGNTKITALPDSIGELKSLQKLNLSFTRITALPERIGELPKLRSLDLMWLTLDTIPRSLAFRGLPFVEEAIWHSGDTGVNVFGLTLRNQNLSVFTQTPELIPSLYDDLVEVRECKVIFLGDGGAGKSYTIKRFLNGGRKESPEEPYTTSQTPGIDIVDYRVDRGEDGFNIHFWDFGGQVILHSMHRCFLTEQTCYVVLVKTRETTATQRARYWLRNVTAFAPNSPILLLVNCWDNDDGLRSIDEASLRHEFPKIADIVYLSAKNCGEDKFRGFMDKLINMAEQSEWCRQMVNRRWDEVRREITGDSRNYLTKTDYHKLCKDKGIAEPDAAPLLTFFNNQGVCFSYHRDRNRVELADYRLLNPEWLTNAVYAIIEEGMAGAQEGRIRAEYIQQILGNAPPSAVRGNTDYRRTIPDLIYKDYECDYVTEVAAAYNLCYPIDRDKLFFPALCTNNTPVNELNDTAGYPQHISYQLRYKYLPDSVVHQLMIRCMRRELVVKNCWLQGMILGGMEMHKAIIRMGGDDTTLIIDIYSKANHPAYELFKVIRDEILEINHDLNLTGIKEFIVKGSDKFTVAALLSASKKTDVMFGENGDEYQASELLGKFYDQWTVDHMNVSEGMIHIPIRKIDYHRCSKSYKPLRQALWEVYDGLCQVCHNPIDSFDNMQVDHIFPTNWDKNDDSAARYCDVLRQQGMDTEKPDFVENYLPTHRGCNLRKSNHINILLTMERHSIALNNTKKVLKAMKKRENELKNQQ